MENKSGFMSPSDKAQIGLSLIQDAILEVLSKERSGLSNEQISDFLGIRSSHCAISWAVCKHLVANNRINYEKPKDIYFL